MRTPCESNMSSTRGETRRDISSTEKTDTLEYLSAANELIRFIHQLEKNEAENSPMTIIGMARIRRVIKRATWRPFIRECRAERS